MKCLFISMSFALLVFGGIAHAAPRCVELGTDFYLSLPQFVDSYGTESDATSKEGLLFEPGNPPVLQQTVADASFIAAPGNNGDYNVNVTEINAGDSTGVWWLQVEGTISGVVVHDKIFIEVKNDNECGDELDNIRVTTFEISAATSGTSFTIANGLDHDGGAITLATDSFVGTYMVAYNRSTGQCPVVGEGVFADDVTSGGVVTVKESDMPGSGFSATPTTTGVNACNVEVRP